MRWSDRYRVPSPSESFSLASRDPGDRWDLDKDDGPTRLQATVDQLGELQNRLYAMDRWAVLLIFQAMDAAGKDSTIKHVLSGINPQGCQVFSFKAPSDEELDHDFLWRSQRALPERGRIGVHNRSHYEEVVIVRVHPEILARQRLPVRPPDDELWPQRMRQINAFERHLFENGTLILKFFLHVSKDEQRKRFLERLGEPEKHWKFSPRDVHERTHWDRYMAAYQEALKHTSTPWAPWFVVPADRKWFTRMAVAEIVREQMEALDLQFPTVPPAIMEQWAEVRRQLEAE
jgi:PPK2 family polyphosphate:nucleotide phosphotransferase